MKTNGRRERLAKVRSPLPALRCVQLLFEARIAADRFEILFATTRASVTTASPAPPAKLSR
jgi:hypothetical protein